MLITHDPTEAFLLADEIAIIEAGRVTQVGTADDIRLRPKTKYVADLAGSNLVIGTASAGSVAVDGHIVHVADTALEGEVIATIHPHAISVHLQQPQGSPRNAWQTTITRLEHFGDRVYRTIVPRNVRLAEAPSYGLPVMVYDKTSRGALAYLALAGEMLRRETRNRAQASA